MNNNIQRENWTGFEFFRLTPRINRIKHLGLFSFSLAIIIASGIVNALIMSNITNIFFTIFVVIIAINVLFLKIRRLNDFNYSGWWILLTFIPLLGLIWVIAIFCIPGTKGKNKFGDEPKLVSKYYQWMILAAPIVITVAIILGSLSVFPVTEDWRVYTNKHYSVEFPGDYQTVQNEMYGLPYETSTYEVRDFTTYTVMADYSKSSDETLQKVANAMGLESIENILQAPAQAFATKLLVADSSARDTKILSDSVLNDQSVPGRALKISCEVDKDTNLIVKAKIYLDKTNKIYYMVTSWYFQDSRMARNSQIADHFLNSFKLL